MDRDTQYTILAIATSAAVGFFTMHALFAYDPKPTRLMLIMFFAAVVVATTAQRIVRDVTSERIALVSLNFSLGCLTRTILQFFV